MAQQRLLYVVGARPNFVKMAPVVAELQRRLPDAEHVVVHTGQHYDAELSELFIDQLGLPSRRTGSTSDRARMPSRRPARWSGSSRS